MNSEPSQNQVETWPSPIPAKRWWGFRKDHPGKEAFVSTETFNIAQQSELFAGMPLRERASLGRLLKRGQKIEIEVFLRTHGPNPLFDPQAEIDIPLGVAKADAVDLSAPPTAEALAAILDGHVVHVLFQAGEASRFNQGPFYKLNPTEIARSLRHEPSINDALSNLERLAKSLPDNVARFLVDGELGPKQSVMMSAALRRAVSWEVELGLLPMAKADSRYRSALAAQKVLYFVNRHHGVNDLHDSSLRAHRFFGFDPSNIVTIEQDLVPGIRLDEEGNIFLQEEEWAQDAGGHLYALIQAARPKGFVTYDPTGKQTRSTEIDAFTYLSRRGGRYLNVIRINDMDRHTTEIINPKALSYALRMFERGYVNVIEGVSNPGGQKGGTGMTLGDPEVHILTETHENSFPSLSRAFEAALKRYLAENQGQHPAYNAMRQWADLTATRQAVQEFGGRIVYVPRRKQANEVESWYIGVDMPMGDLSLLGSAYKSRMFQLVTPEGQALQIHDMKQPDQLSLHLETVRHQLGDPFVVEAVTEVLSGSSVPIKKTPLSDLYDAPAPELLSNPKS